MAKTQNPKSKSRSPMNFRELSKLYLRSSQWEILSENSKRNYKSRINILRKIQPNSETSSDWFVAINNLKTSNSTKKWTTSVLKSVYCWAIFNNLSTQNPVDTFPKNAWHHEKKETKPFTKAEIEELWRRSENNEKIYVCALRFMFYTGCRPSEIYNLKWRNVDLQNNYISIIGAKRREKDKVSRKCKIVQEAMECLIWISENTVCRGKYKNFWSQDPEWHVFRGFRGEKLNSCYMGRVIKKALRRAEMESREIRQTRSGLATEMIRNNYPIHVVQAQLGHKSIGTTARYINQTLEEKAEMYKGV